MFKTTFPFVLGGITSSVEVHKESRFSTQPILGLSILASYMCNSVPCIHTHKDSSTTFLRNVVEMEDDGDG